MIININKKFNIKVQMSVDCPGKNEKYIKN